MRFPAGNYGVCKENASLSPAAPERTIINHLRIGDTRYGEFKLQVHASALCTCTPRFTCSGPVPGCLHRRRQSSRRRELLVRLYRLQQFTKMLPQRLPVSLQYRKRFRQVLPEHPHQPSVHLLRLLQRIVGITDQTALWTHRTCCVLSFQLFSKNLRPKWGGNAWAASYSSQAGFRPAILLFEVQP